MGLAETEPAASRGGSAPASADADERAKLRERAFELGLKPPTAATAVELERMVDANDYVELTLETRAALLDYIRDHPACSVAEACRHVKVKRHEVRALLRSDADFHEDYERVRGRATLEDIYAATEKLAIEGVEKPVVSAGKLVYYPEGHPQAGEIVTVREYSEKLLEFLNRTRTPEGKAADARKLGIEISGPDGAPVQVQSGVSLGDVLHVLAAAGVDLPGLAAAAQPEIEGEIVAETDEPAP